MAILPNHDVTIGNMGFYAGDCKSDQPVAAWNYDTVEIELGLPRVYKTNIKPRHMTFTVVINSSNRMAERKKIDALVGIHPFNSIYIGSFNAVIKVQYDFPNGYPNTINVNFDVTEVPS